MAKDPKRQLLGKIARQKGQYFEQRLDSTFDYYRERGYAEIEKTPEPMKVIKPEGNGRLHQKGAGRLQRHNQGRQDGPV